VLLPEQHRWITLISYCYESHDCENCVDDSFQFLMLLYDTEFLSVINSFCYLVVVVHVLATRLYDIETSVEFLYSV